MIKVFNCSIDLSKLRSLSERIESEQQYLMSEAEFERVKDEFVHAVTDSGYIKMEDAQLAVDEARLELESLNTAGDSRYYCTLLAIKQLMDEKLGAQNYYFPLHALFLYFTLATLDGCRISGDLADYFNRHRLRFNISIPGTPQGNHLLTEEFVSCVRKFFSEREVADVLKRLFSFDQDNSDETFVNLPYFYLYDNLPSESDEPAYNFITITAATRFAAAALRMDVQNISDPLFEIAEHIRVDSSFPLKDKYVCVENFERPWELCQLLDSNGGYYVTRPFCEHASMLNEIIKRIFEEHTDTVTFKRISMLGSKVVDEYEVQVLHAQEFLNDNVLDAYPNVQTIIRMRHHTADRRVKTSAKDLYTSYLSNIKFIRPNKPEKAIMACICSTLVQDTPHPILELSRICAGRFRATAFDPNTVNMDPLVYKLINECVEYTRNTTPPDGLATHKRTKPEYKNLIGIMQRKTHVQLLIDLCEQINRRYSPSITSP